MARGQKKKKITKLLMYNGCRAEVLYKLTVNDVFERVEKLDGDTVMIKLGTLATKT